MPPPRSLTLVASAAVLAGACGGGPRLEPAVAEDLAARADALAASLDGGDECAALAAGDDLVDAATAARQAGTVPDDVAAEVIATARDTVQGLECAPASPEPTPAEPPPDDDDTDDDKGPKGDEKDDEKDDDPQGGERGKGEGRGKSDD